MYNLINYLFKVLNLVKDIEAGMKDGPGRGRLVVKYEGKFYVLEATAIEASDNDMSSLLNIFG
ncbi:MAG: hypothetical protein PHF63_00035 [Herbinix sp.]|nr:hypothetical protein [Herbinix sp.]